jgi:hypothetical protein
MGPPVLRRAKKEVMRNFAIVAALGFALFASRTARAEDIDNPEYLSWKGCKAGSFVQTKTVMDGAMKMETESTTTLVEITAEKAVVETKGKMHMGANVIDQPAQKRDIPAKVKKVEGGEAKGEKPKEGEETVKVDGKDVKAHWTESHTEANGSKTDTKVWQSKDVPGLMVKMESKTTGPANSTMTITVEKFEKK